MNCNRIGGIYKLEIAESGGAFAPYLFTPNTASITDTSKQDEKGAYIEIEAAFSFSRGKHPAQYLALLGLVAKGVKLRITAADGAAWLYGSNIEPLEINITREAALDSVVLVNIKGVALCV